MTSSSERRKALASLAAALFGHFTAQATLRQHRLAGNQASAEAITATLKAMKVVMGPSGVPDAPFMAAHSALVLVEGAANALSNAQLPAAEVHERLKEAQERLVAFNAALKDVGKARPPQAA